MIPGDKVILNHFTENEHDMDKVLAGKYLKPGTVYTVRKVHIFRLRSDIGLNEVPGLLFNSTLFSMWEGENQ